MLPEKYVRWVMVVAGLLTCTMLYATFAPHAALLKNFDTTFTGPAVEVAVRTSWFSSRSCCSLRAICWAGRSASRSRRIP